MFELSLVVNYLDADTFRALLGVNRLTHRLCLSETSLRSFFAKYDPPELTTKILYRAVGYLARYSTYIHPRLQPLLLRWAADEYVIDIFDQLWCLYRSTGGRLWILIAFEVKEAWSLSENYCTALRHNQELLIIEGIKVKHTVPQVDQAKALGSSLYFRSSLGIWQRCLLGYDPGSAPEAVIDYQEIINADHYFDYILDVRSRLIVDNLVVARYVTKVYHVLNNIYYLTELDNLYIYNRGFKSSDLIARNVCQGLENYELYYLTRSGEVYSTHSAGVIEKDISALSIYKDRVYYATEKEIFVHNERHRPIYCPCFRRPIIAFQIFTRSPTKWQEVEYCLVSHH